MTASQPAPTLEPMSTIELPDDVAAALTAAAAERGLTEAELIGEFVADGRGVSREAKTARRGEALDAFLGCADSGDPDWASTDTKVLRKQAAARKSADRV